MFAILEFTCLILAAVVAGMFFGPWAALTRTIDQLEPVAFVPVLHQLSPNMAKVMTVLMPLILVVLIPAIWLTYGQGIEFYLYLSAFVLFAVALIVTTAIEVPLVKQMEKWTPAAMPPGWQNVRDRWMAFHIVRILCGLAALAALVAALVFR